MSRPIKSERRSRLRCSRCLRPEPVCYCSQIPCRQPNRWPVRIVQDVRESSHAIGTARMAALSLNDCELITINPDQPDQAEDLAQMDVLRHSQPVLIYPGDHAGTLAELASLPVAPLLFIDASWRRSRKVLQTYPWMQRLPRYALAAGISSRYRIRQQPVESALSTLEAIVYTLQQLESQAPRYDALLATMDWVVDQQIKYMGEAIWQSNYSTLKKEL